MGLIVAGFAGVGKSHFCKQTPNTLDFHIMPFKYSNFYEVSKTLVEDEDIKAHEDLEYVVAWDKYYYHALLDTVKKYLDQIIVIPTVASILERLKRDNISVTIHRYDRNLHGRAVVAVPDDQAGKAMDFR